MCSAGSAWALPQAGSPIRIPPDHRLLPTPRRFSQVAASFFGTWCLGIHLGPLVACSACSHSSIPEARYRLHQEESSHRLGNRQESRISTYSVDNVLSGDDRTRTGDPLLAKQVLSQLSYIPVRPRFGPDRGHLLTARLPRASLRLRAPARGRSFSP